MRHPTSTCPHGAPAWARDRAKLWNAAEMREVNKDKRAKSDFKANAQTARDFMFSLSRRVVAGGQAEDGARIDCPAIWSTRTASRSISAIHEPGQGGRRAELPLPHDDSTTRRMTAKGFGEKAREWDDLKNAPKLSKAVAHIYRRHDQRRAQSRRQGRPRSCRISQFQGAGQRTGSDPSSRAGQNHTDAARTGARARQAWTKAQQPGPEGAPRQGTCFPEIAAGFCVAGQACRLAQRGRDGAAAIRRELQEQRQADTAATGLRRVFQIVTGRKAARAFRPAGAGRAAHSGSRETGRYNALKREVRAERSAFATAQTKDRAALIERHGVEDRQLTQTVISREFADKAAERSGRQREPRRRAIEQERQRGPDRGREPSP